MHNFRSPGDISVFHIHIVFILELSNVYFYCNFVYSTEAQEVIGRGTIQWHLSKLQ
jgi:hypothetical protein